MANMGKVGLTADNGWKSAWDQRWDIFKSYGTKIPKKKIMGLNWDLCQSYGTKIATKKVMGPNWDLCHSYGTKSAL